MSNSNKKRGGYRPNAGRKKDPVKDVRLGAAVALKLLKEMKAEEEIKKIFKATADERLKVHISFRLMEWGYGKPVEPKEDKIVFDPNAPLRVIVEQIGGQA